MLDLLLFESSHIVRKSGQFARHHHCQCSSPRMLQQRRQGTFFYQDYRIYRKGLNQDSARGLTENAGPE
jgi:hypothetical protein